MWPVAFVAGVIVRELWYFKQQTAEYRRGLEWREAAGLEYGQCLRRLRDCPLGEHITVTLVHEDAATRLLRDGYAIQRTTPCNRKNGDERIVFPVDYVISTDTGGGQK